MSAVFKYELKVPNGSSATCLDVRLPLGAKILKIAAQHGEYYVWCLIETDEPETRAHRYMVISTGHVFDGRKLIGLGYQETLLVHDGRLVLHFWLEL